MMGWRYGYGWFSGLLGLVLAGCSSVLPQRPPSPHPHTSLHRTLFKRTDPEGRLLWQLQATEVEMSDGEVIQLKGLQGTFYHNQKPIYSLQAPHGRVHQHSHFIQLQGPIVVKNMRDRMILKSQHLQWHPRTGQLLAQSQVHLQHPHFEMKGQRFQASTQTHESRLSGGITVQLDRDLQLQAQDISWSPTQKTLSAHSQLPAKVRVQPRPDQPSSLPPWQQVQAQRVNLHVQSQQLIFEQAVEVHFLDPKMRIGSPRLVVSLTEETWYCPQGMQVQYQGMSAQSRRGWLEPSQILHLQDQVQVQGLPQQAQLRAQALSWNLATQDLHAHGQLVYEQRQPWMRMTGARATGNLRHTTLEVEGGEAVVEIVP